MPSIRIGLSTQFNIENEQVGIGTTNPTATLEVLGDIKTSDVAGAGGISTFKEYQGFQQTQQGITNNIVIDNGTSGPFSSLAGEILITGETTISSGSTAEVGKTKTLTVTDRFAVPLGETNNRDVAPEAGTTRFNQDFGTLEFFDGNNWKTVNSYARYGAAGRGVFAGGSPGSTNIIDYVNITTLGNAIDFGRLGSGTMTQGGSCSSATRGLHGGGENPSITNSIEYFTLASGGDAIDFGDLSETRRRIQEGACSSSTRGIWSGGYNPGLSPASRDTIDYVEISTLGNALDFGNLIGNRESGAACSSATRGIYASGRNQPTNRPLDEIQFFTIASKGNALEFGKITEFRYGLSSGSNSVRGFFAGGNNNYAPVARLSIIDYITITSTGNAIDFGNLSEAIEYPMATAGQTRGLIAGGNNPSSSNVIQYITIASTGNAQDFGDLTSARAEGSACSDSHGGLGGF